jgi:hypothetical protein
MTQSSAPYSSVFTISDCVRNLNSSPRDGREPSAFRVVLVRIDLSRSPTRPPLPCFLNPSLVMILLQFSILALPVRKALNKMTWKAVLYVNLKRSTRVQYCAISKSNLLTVVKFCSGFLLMSMPTDSKLTRENILDSNLIEVSFGLPYPRIWVDSISLSDSGAIRGSPPGKKTLSISKKRNTYS